VSKVHVREKRKTGRKEGEERGSKMDYATTDSKKKLHCHLPPPPLLLLFTKKVS
jgi:hypothetical protein